MTTENLSPQQEFEVVRRVQFGTFLQAYTHLTDTLDKSFLSMQQREIVRKEFDNGYLWAKEYFLTAMPPAAPEIPKEAEDKGPADAADNGAALDAA